MSKKSRIWNGEPVSILFDVQKCRFVSPYPEDEIRRALRVLVPGYIHMPSYQDGRWDGYHNYVTRNGTFPTGLLPRVYCILKQGYDPYDENRTPFYFSGVPVRFCFTETSQKYFHNSFINYYINEESSMWDFMIVNQTEYVDLNTTEFMSRLDYLFKGPTQEIPALNLINLLDLNQE